MRNLIVVVGLLALAACGGGKKAAPEPLSGALEAGRTAGIHYQTPTQSGTTDANGTFQYLPGETVVFSIGGVELGAVPGAAKISLFTLAGMTPPSSEVVLRREIDRARRQPTPLSRVMNLSRLLIALDADNNPDNGIDVSGRAAELANKQIDLGLELRAFAGKLDRLAPNMTRNIPWERTLVFPFQALNLTVATHGPVRYEADSDPLSLRNSTITYLPNGLRSVDRSDTSGFVTSLAQSTDTYSYDALGRMTGIASEYGLNLGQPPSGSRSSVTFDARGNRVTSLTEFQSLGSLYYRSSIAFTADAFGRYPETTSSVDEDGDGVVDSRQVARQTFDARGNPVSNITTFDGNADGVIDNRYTLTLTFDALDRLQSEIYEGDQNADGVVDVRVVTTVANEGPRVLIRTVDQDDGVDGVVDLRSTTRYVYDSAGNNTSVTVRDSSGPDDTVYAYAEFTMTYDDEKRLLSQVRTNADEVGGVPLASASLTNVYDDRGNLIRATSEYGGQTFGSPLRQVIEHTYRADGARTQFKVIVDVENDGTNDSEYTTRITNQEFPDGVLTLAQQYFAFGSGLLNLDYTSDFGGLGGATIPN